MDSVFKLASSSHSVCFLLLEKNINQSSKQTVCLQDGWDRVSISSCRKQRKRTLGLNDAMEVLLLLTKVLLSVNRSTLFTEQSFSFKDSLSLVEVSLCGVTAVVSTQIARLRVSLTGLFSKRQKKKEVEEV